MNPETFDPDLAHIIDGENVFQILNDDGSDWDEDATRALYEAWKAQNGGA